MVASPFVETSFKESDLVPVRARVAEPDRKQAKKLAIELECTVEEVYGLLIHSQLKQITAKLQLDNA